MSNVESDAYRAASDAWYGEVGISALVGNYTRLEAACRAYHRAMIAATPGLCVHEPDGTVRAATVQDCENASRTAWVRWQVRNHREGTP